MPQIFNASNYFTRQDLENHIAVLASQNAEENKKAGHQIKGTKSELKKLQLSDQCTIWGIPVISTDDSTEKDLKEKLSKKGKIWE